MAVYLAFIALFICALELFVVLMLCAAGELTMQRRPSTNLTYFHQSWRNHSIFPICNKLHIYDIDNINISWFEESRLFSSWLKDESMFCGKFKQPTLSSLFGWKSKTSSKVLYWRNGCARQIRAAKRRLFALLAALCSYHATNISATNTSFSKDRMDKNGVCRNDGIGSVQRDTTEVRRPPPRSPAGATHHSVSQKYSSVGTRGIVYTGEVKHFKGIYQSITSLVQSNTSLPVEVWVNHYAFAPCSRIFYSFAFVQCRCFGDRELSSANSREDLSSGHAYACHSSVLVLGFESKFHALLSTHFQHVLYLDSDNIVTRNAEEVFNTVAYVDTGAVLWPDLWGVACSDTSRILSGHTASSQYVLWRAGFPGLDEHTHTIPEYYKRRRSNQCAADMHGDGCTRSSDNFGSSEDEGGKVCFNTSHADSTIAEHNCSYKYFHCRSSTQSSQWKHYLREHGQEAESGQLVLNLQLHKPLLSLGLHLIQDSAFFGRVFYGDKDIFRFIFLITGVPFHFMGIPGISVDASGRQDSLLHFHSSAGDAESDLADPPLSIQQQQPQKEQQHKATKTVLHVSAIDNCCARDIFQETAFGHHRSEDNKSIGENAALSALYRTQEILPLFVHQLRLRDPDALLRFIRVPPQHQGNASYCLVPRKRQYIHRSASAHSCVVNRTCSEWGSHDDCTDSSSTHSCHNRLGGSGVLVQPREARLLRDFARRLFDTVDAHWRQIEALNGTVAQ